jgi:two-component system chemotaxis response regulator CheB
MIRLILAGMKPDWVAHITGGLNHKPGIEMIISVETPAEAENKLNRQNMNVLLTDLDNALINEARINAMRSRYGLLALFTSISSVKARPFLKNGTDDFLYKPPTVNPQSIAQYQSVLYKRLNGFRNQIVPVGIRDIAKMADGSKKVIAIASSTGGTNALEQILQKLPPDAPPVVVVQHMPSGFTKLFADRLNAVYSINIKEAQTGDYLKQGQVLLAPADRHMKIVRQQSLLAVDCYVGIKIHGVMPAADVLFESVAELVKANAIGVILTGMGADGARGLMLMHLAGAKTIGQDKSTCVVYGMPKVAKDLGAVDYELPIGQIADKILALV